MFPGQQGATWPSQLWPPRLGIKLLEGAPSTEKWGKGGYFRMASRKIGVISLVFAQWVKRPQSGHINPATPVWGGGQKGSKHGPVEPTGSKELGLV